MGDPAGGPDQPQDPARAGKVTNAPYVHVPGLLRLGVDDAGTPHAPLPRPHQREAPLHPALNRRLRHARHHRPVRVHRLADAVRRGLWQAPDIMQGGRGRDDGTFGTSGAGGSGADGPERAYWQRLGRCRHVRRQNGRLWFSRQDGEGVGPCNRQMPRHLQRSYQPRPVRGCHIRRQNGHLGFR